MLGSTHEDDDEEEDDDEDEDDDDEEEDDSDNSDDPTSVVDGMQTSRSLLPLRLESSKTKSGSSDSSSVLCSSSSKSPQTGWDCAMRGRSSPTSGGCSARDETGG